MKRGLIIGKFMPIHKGHIALINFALSHCDEVTVSMSFTEKDSISPEYRIGWIKEIFQGNRKINTQLVKDDFDREDLPWDERIGIWSDFVKSRYPQANVIVSSEAYGPRLAKELGVEHISFDPLRKQFPVSATQIRERPFQHWDYIPKEVRPYFVKKICFYGPESTGKSFMAMRMAEKYNTEFVPEVAREIVSSNDFTLDDIIRIGNAQTTRVLEKSKAANKILFCDSDLITTQIYSHHYLKEVPPVLFELENRVSYNLYFLFDIDTPWVADGLRDLGNRREEMLTVFKDELHKRGIPYVLVCGNWNERERIVKSEVDKLLS